MTGSHMPSPSFLGEGMIMKTQPESSASPLKEQGILRAQTKSWSAPNFRQLGTSPLGPFGLFQGLSGLWTSPCPHLIWLSCAQTKFVSSKMAAAQSSGSWAKGRMVALYFKVLINNDLSDFSSEQKSFQNQLLYLTRFLKFTPSRLVLRPLGNTRFHTNTRRHADFG